VEYHPHLIWIQQESIGVSVRSKWLQNVLDCLSEELHKVQPRVDNSWRSLSLHCLLIRAFYGILDENVTRIEAMALARINPTLKKLTIANWLKFYTLIDPVDPLYKDRWIDLRTPCPKDEHPNTGMAVIHTSYR
jgi:hypothetical protein